MNSIEEVRAHFADDRFAALAGIKIIEVETGRAVCQMELRPHHMNANNTPMGGAIFTLADLAFAVAANVGNSDSRTVSQHMSITFLSPAKGKTLIAEAKRIKAGRRTCLYEVSVTDELGTLVAHATGNGFTV